MPLVQGRKRRSEAAEDASPDSSPEPATQRRRTSPDSADEAYGNDAGTQSDTTVDQMVAKMVRLALACEYHRRPIRRADISEKVLGSSGGRQFKTVFNQAQLQLRTVFGMEMAELPAREKVTLAQRRAAQKQSQTAKSATSWILVSILPPQYRDPAILDPPAVPTSAEESKYVSIYTLLISLVQLSGGTLPDAKMDRYLRRVNMEDSTPVSGFAKTEQLLKRLEKDGYVYKVREPTGTGDDDVYWVVGPRGKTEVDDEGVRGLVKEVYGAMGEDAHEELETKIAKSLSIGQKAVAKGHEQQQNGGAEKQKKRRGRPKKNQQNEEDDEDEESEEEEDD